MAILENRRSRLLRLFDVGLLVGLIALEALVVTLGRGLSFWPRLLAETAPVLPLTAVGGGVLAALGWVRASREEARPWLLLLVHLLLAAWATLTLLVRADSSGLDLVLLPACVQVGTAALVDAALRALFVRYY